ncbi:hypothetical protein BX616_002977 [Lobosporangium transversale]|uniref:MutT/nudix family protein n=1 Tax=Lobosporangium transversale TaxID=64571 RepID=A0A1Y2GBU0_9FUNG|nr:hypothetical protein BCR41DRAFT_374073 [Lobosporangium transversale]KAF9919008.1 hypothetical protein BX616_002977 [Lobosporangium transversale]ORZ06352.1 hypothetical protein BCR41DRAFT_374073 [Lobosporangium transversale]|eukprot:XP_021877515.1 hypothetical protein BCR41DRAFT_374073 [Lobosporangium transversale]
MESTTKTVSPIDKQLARFKEIEVGGSQYLDRLTAGDREAIPLLVQVGKLLDQIYIRQRWSGNEALHSYIHSQNPRDPKLDLGLQLFKGPWGLNEERFIDSIKERGDDGNIHEKIHIPHHPPPHGNFYPDGIKREEYLDWVAGLEGQDKLNAESYYHVVKRDATTGKLYSVSYSNEYKEFLVPASKLLKQAADLVSDESLAKFLKSRAEAFITNEYTESDVDWLRISKESALDVTCGPYENYTDKMLNVRTAYEFFLNARDFDSSAILAKFSSRLQDMEDQMPVDELYKAKGLYPPAIITVNQLYSGGDVAVPMTAAYNLPNDEAPIKIAGSKLVIIKNVQEGKFEKVLRPIAQQVLDSDQLGKVEFEAFFQHVLMHEVAHSLGPHFLVRDKAKKVRTALEEYHAAMEEAKADIAGLYAVGLLLKDGTLSGNPDAESFYITYLASAFRSIRFGITQAHGLGQAMQFEYIKEQGGFSYNTETRKFRVVMDKIEGAVRSLTTRILVLQGDGDKQKVKEFVDKYGVISPEVKEALSTLEDLGVPVDVYPKYRILEDGTI